MFTLLAVIVIGATPNDPVASVSPDNLTLTFMIKGKRVNATPTLIDQAGFAQPHISSDQRTVGWVALQSNAATSYPLPTSLVIMKGGKVVRHFEPSFGAIWAWRFEDEDTVAFMNQFPHGGNPVHYSRYRISDGRALDSFTCFPPGLLEQGQSPVLTFENALLDGGVPAWVWPLVTGDCPPRERSDGGR